MLLIRSSQASGDTLPNSFRENNFVSVEERFHRDAFKRCWKKLSRDSEKKLTQKLTSGKRLQSDTERRMRNNCRLDEGRDQGRLSYSKHDWPFFGRHAKFHVFPKKLL